MDLLDFSVSYMGSFPIKGPEMNFGRLSQSQKYLIVFVEKYHTVWFLLVLTVKSNFTIFEDGNCT